MLSNSQLEKIIKRSKIIPADTLKKALKEAADQEISLEKILTDKGIIDTAVLYEKIARAYKVPFVNLKDQLIRKDVLFLIPESIASTHKLIAFEKNAKELKVATTDPSNLEIFEFLNKKTGLDIKIYVASHKDISEILKLYHKSLKAEFSEISKLEKTEKGGRGKKLEKLASDLPVVRVVNTLLEYAIFQDASDIHIEPGEKEIVIRYRIDGILQDVMTLPRSSATSIVARIKILANLKVDEHRLPQDGRFKIANEDYRVSFRVSIIPTYEGEKVVMRLLNEKAQIINLDQLGFQPAALEAIKRNINEPNGMILATGPTGSGKTTTLYTILSTLNTEDVNISTVEDPIEYRMERVNQTQINPKVGLTFALGLRALLRQDPDIIMVGEIRDEETAEIAVHAAMTGHIVLSTLHTNDAPSAIPRLRDMGVQNFLISSTLNLIIAQRLVRKICPNCIQSYNLTKNMVEDLSQQLNIDNLLEKLENAKVIQSAGKGMETLLFYQGKGCEKCNQTGYKGRIGVYEILEITPEIADMINDKKTANDIKKYAEKKGMITMLEDGFIKAKNGITTIEEIMRAAKE